jgi:hypothetical protein
MSDGAANIEKTGGQVSDNDLSDHCHEPACIFCSAKRFSLCQTLEVSRECLPLLLFDKATDKPQLLLPAKK